MIATINPARQWTRVSIMARATKAPLALAALALAAATPASAQTAAAPPPAAAPAKPKPVATIPIRPALQTPADTAGAMTALERRAIQSDLAWAGKFNGVINGEVSERMVAAIKAFQKDRNAKQTGVLNPQERGALFEAARKMQEKVGWKLSTEMVTGARLGLPAKLMVQHSADANGSRWTSAGGAIQISLMRRKETEPTSAKLAEQERRDPARKVEYSLVRPDFFVLSGTQGPKKFYLRGSFRDAEARVLTILYDPGQEATMEPVVIAMSSAFNPFPAAATAAGPPPRKPVEYGTGIVVSADGAVLTDRTLIEGCRSIVIPGFGNADRVAEDKKVDLALLRIYGARDLAPVAIATGAAATLVELTGIADPQNQAGGGAISRVTATVMPGNGGEITLTPAPGLGFSGAAAFGPDRQFAGLVQLKPVVVAGPAPPAQAAPAQAVLVPLPAIAAFLQANAVATNTVATATSASGAGASIVRVICVRK